MSTAYLKSTPQTEANSVDDYFARMSSYDCADELTQKIEDYYHAMKRLGRSAMYRNSYFKYLSSWVTKGYVTPGGSEGELQNTTVNHYGNLVTHVVNMVCQQRLAWQPEVDDADSTAMEEIKLAKGELKRYAKRSDIDVDGKLRQATEFAVVFGDSHVSVLWDFNKGKEVTVDTESRQTVREGDVEIKVWTPFDTIQDHNVPSIANRKWLILRDWQNKYDLAAEYPKWEKEVIGLTPTTELDDTQLTYTMLSEGELIPVYYFFHERTPAVPAGRFMKFVSCDVVLEDDTLDEARYRELPVYRMCARELIGSTFGYSRAFDALSLQDIVDRLTSAVLTNNLTFAIQNILIPKGASFSWDQVYGGLNVLEWDPKLGPESKPEALQLTRSAPETYQFIDKAIQHMGTIFGVNEVSRGNPDLVLKGQVSGAALALMNTNSIQFNTDLNKAYTRLAEQVGTAIIHEITDFSKTTREGMSLTATNKMVRKQYQGSALRKISRVSIRYGNPLSQTVSGCLQLAESLLNNGLLKDPQEYINVANTGDLDALTQSSQDELMLIKAENEALERGESVPAIMLDDHPTHILEHRTVVGTLEARRDPKIVQAVNQHIEMHLQFLQNLPPVIAGLTKQPVLNAPTPAGKPGGPTPPRPGQTPMPQNAGNAAPQPQPSPTTGQPQ